MWGVCVLLPSPPHLRYVSAESVQMRTSSGSIGSRDSCRALAKNSRPGISSAIGWDPGIPCCALFLRGTTPRRRYNAQSDKGAVVGHWGGDAAAVHPCGGVFIRRWAGADNPDGRAYDDGAIAYGGGAPGGAGGRGSTCRAWGCAEGAARDQPAANRADGESSSCAGGRWHC